MGLNFNLKTDLAILSKESMNENYHLVERPKLLMHFENKELEAKYVVNQLQRNFS